MSIKTNILNVADYIDFVNYVAEKPVERIVIKKKSDKKYTGGYMYYNLYFVLKDGTNANVGVRLVNIPLGIKEPNKEKCGEGKGYFRLRLKGDTIYKDKQTGKEYKIGEAFIKLNDAISAKATKHFGTRPQRLFVQKSAINKDNEQKEIDPLVWIVLPNVSDHEFWTKKGRVPGSIVPRVFNMKQLADKAFQKKVKGLYKDTYRDYYYGNYQRIFDEKTGDLTGHKLMEYWQAPSSALASIVPDVLMAKADLVLGRLKTYGDIVVTPRKRKVREPATKDELAEMAMARDDEPEEADDELSSEGTEGTEGTSNNNPPETTTDVAAEDFNSDDE